MIDRKINQTDATKVNTDDLMAFVYYVKVTKNVNTNELLVADLDNNDNLISVKGKELIQRAFSADQYAEEMKITKTQAAELLVNSPNRPFTVSFQKTDGSERVIRGRLVRPEPLLGRSMVEDLDKSGTDRLRQVDHRTINFLIVDGTKYIVK